MPTIDVGLVANEYDECFNCGVRLVREHGNAGRFVHEADGQPLLQMP